jgi:hypothetical protein
MRMGCRNVVAGTLVVTILVFLTMLIYWAATGVGQAAVGDSIGKLTRATSCAVSAYHVMAGEDATMTVENDGGWCWVDIYERGNWRPLSASFVAVTNASKHGHVLVLDIANQEVRLAYQPDAGFAGRDSFTLHYNTDNSERTFSVTVSMPAITSVLGRLEERDFAKRRLTEGLAGRPR